MAPAYDNPTLIANTVLGYIFFAGSCLTPVVVPIFLVLYNTKVLNPSPTFAKFYGSLFAEFRNDKGTLSTLFYAWFLIRRFLYITNIIMLRDMG